MPDTDAGIINESDLNNHYPHPILAREGWPFIAISVLLAVLITIWLGGLIGLLFWLLALFVVQFFRDPARVVPDQPDAILAPADGRVIKVEKARDEHANRDALKISIFMNVFNVHSNRIPADVRVTKAEYFAGKFFNADLDKASESNERNALVLERHDGQQITCVQVAGLIARRILCYVTVNDNLKRGARFGFIRFGSRVDVFLPLHAEPKVSIGEKVSATSTVIATFSVTEGASGRAQGQ